MLFGVNLPSSLPCRYCKSPEIRKNGLNDRFIINARVCCDCQITLTREEIVFYAVLLVIGLIGVGLAVLVVENFSAFAVAAQLSFFAWYTPSLPIGLWILISCLFGALIMYLLSIPIALRDRRELSILRKKVAQLEQAQRSAPGGSLQVYPPPIVPIPGISAGLLPPSSPPEL